MMFEQNNSFTVPSIVREEGDVVLHRAEFDDFIKYQIVIEIYVACAFKSEIGARTV